MKICFLIYHDNSVTEELQNFYHRNSNNSQVNISYAVLFFQISDVTWICLNANGYNI